MRFKKIRLLSYHADVGIYNHLSKFIQVLSIQSLCD